MLNVLECKCKSEVVLCGFVYILFEHKHNPFSSTPVLIRCIYISFSQRSNNFANYYGLLIDLTCATSSSKNITVYAIIGV